MNAIDVAALAHHAAGFAPVEVGVDSRDGGKLANLELVAAALAHGGFDLIQSTADAISIVPAKIAIVADAGEVVIHFSRPP